MWPITSMGSRVSFAEEGGGDHPSREREEKGAGVLYNISCRLLFSPFAGNERKKRVFFLFPPPRLSFVAASVSYGRAIIGIGGIDICIAASSLPPFV